MSILFINGSPNKNGNTAVLAAELLKGHEYETLNLTDYTISAYGQNLPGDGLDAVIGAMKQADIVVIGSPLYWHNICGSVRNVLDRFYGKVEDGELSGQMCIRDRYIAGRVSRRCDCECAQTGAFLAATGAVCGDVVE